MDEIMIKDWQGVVIGYVRTDTHTGDKIAFDKQHIILGRYNKRLDITVNFNGIKVAQGDMTSGLIWENAKK